MNGGGVTYGFYMSPPLGRAGEEGNYKEVTKELRKEICFSPTLCVRRERSAFSLELQDAFVGVILLKTLLFLSLEMLQAACKKIAMNSGLFPEVLAMFIQSNRDP